ncbi:MAG: DTW domain-containing protein [Polyangiaceae bacterium]|nr:DTW domain-containing protein [Polyangiaceae bacterium]
MKNLRILHQWLGLAPMPVTQEQADAAPRGRDTCYRCFRPQALCWCQALSPIEPHTQIVIVQHPREQFHPLNTARIVELSLPNSTVIRSGFQNIEKDLLDLQLPKNTALLYPSPDAIDLESIAAEKRPEAIVVVDGTWHQAKTLVRDLPGLQRYQKVRFTPQSPSEYRIRKEPQPDYLSTIESIALALDALKEAPAVSSSLRKSFRHMVDLNLAARKRPVGGRTEEPRRKVRGKVRGHRYPHQLLHSKEDTVALYVEGAGHTSQRKAKAYRIQESEPLLFLARRGQEQCSILLQTGTVPSQRLLQQLQLEATQQEREGVTLESGLTALRRFLGDSPTVAWNASTQRILENLGLSLPQHLELKGAYCDYQRFQALRESREPQQKWGSLSSIASNLSEKAPSSKSRGRAHQRLLDTQNIYFWLKNQFDADPNPFFE